MRKNADLSIFWVVVIAAAFWVGIFKHGLVGRWLHNFSGYLGF